MDSWVYCRMERKRKREWLLVREWKMLKRLSMKKVCRVAASRPHPTHSTPSFSLHDFVSSIPHLEKDPGSRKSQSSVADYKSCRRSSYALFAIRQTFLSTFCSVSKSVLDTRRSGTKGPAASPLILSHFQIILALQIIRLTITAGLRTKNPDTDFKPFDTHIL